MADLKKNPKQPNCFHLKQLNAFVEISVCGILPKKLMYGNVCKYFGE